MEEKKKRKCVVKEYQMTLMVVIKRSEGLNTDMTFSEEGTRGNYVKYMKRRKKINGKAELKGIR